VKESVPMKFDGSTGTPFAISQVPASGTSRILPESMGIGNHQEPAADRYVTRNESCGGG
jgi:hypothetical protein